METMNKVAQITLWFWVMKVLATTLGETAGDFLSMTLGLGYITSLCITMGFFLAVLMAQLLSRRFHAALYWAVIVGTTTVGTEVSDFMDRTLKLGYTAGSITLSTCLLAILAVWYYSEKTLAVYPIFGRRQEIFYWIAVLASNSLGTAFGDFLSDDMKLSYLGGACVTAGIIVLVVLLHYFTRIHEVVLFWIAFVFTRPFGATFGDFLTKPVSQGGIALGTLPASSVTLSLLVLAVFYVSWRSGSRRDDEALAPGRHVEGA
jgi:uncharacterized membrane-anchored protein